MNLQKYQVLADQAVFSGANFLLTLLIARYLDAAAFGVYSAYILMIYLAVSVIGAWGIQVFQVAPDISSSRYISFVFWWQIILMMLVLTGASIFCSLFGIACAPALLVFAFGFVINDFGRKILLASSKTAAALWLDVITALCLVLAFFTFRSKALKDINTMLGYFAVAYAVSLFIIIFLLQPFFIKITSFKHYTTLHLQTGKWLFFTALSQWWAGNLFVVAAGIYLGTAALGALRLAQSLFGILNILLQSFENYVLPQTANRLHQNLAGGMHYLRSVNYKLVWIFLPLLILTFLFAKKILIIVGGNEYADYGYVVQGLCLLYVFILISQPIRFIFRALQFNNHFFYAYLLSLAFALASSHWLLSSFGLYGVIVGLTGSQVIVTAYWITILYFKNISVWKSFISY